MGEIKSFRDLLVWQKGHELVIGIYKITKNFPDEERYNLVSQMRRAAVSIISNLVEGFRRRGVKDSLNFYNRADSSLEELKYQVLLSRDLIYISKEDFTNLNNKCEEVSRMLYSWIKSQRNNKKLNK